jgi:tRNA threonylcarbamoyladenosine biosynthesis protein TsaB
VTRLLAIDTSTWWGGVALVESRAGEPPKLAAEIGLYVEDSHAARLLPMIESVLALAGWDKASLDAYVATRGPGSFTGIRVGLGVLRGLAIASGRPCIGVGTLEAMAEAYGPCAFDRVPLLDAGRGEVYGARYDPLSSPPREVEPPWVGDPERAVAGREGDPVAVFGGGAVQHESRLRAAGYRGTAAPTPTSIAAAAARIAAARPDGPADGARDVAPLYVRPADAELKLR